MISEDPRAALDRLIQQGGHSYASISRVLKRNPAYIQQYIKRGTPARLEEQDRGRLARYLGVSEALLGGPGHSVDAATVARIRRLSVEASAGPGTMVEGEAALGHYAFDARWLRGVSASQPDELAIVQVAGDSMSPTLTDGDDILVDHSRAALRLRDGIYVLRREDTLMVKRLALNPLAGTVSIVSDNPSYPTWADCPLDSVDVVGRVVWAGRRIR
jgi:hypothetical protein